MESISRISCSYFQHISSSNKGTIINCRERTVIIEHSDFHTISSSSNPGCFYLENAKLELNNCQFAFCQASGLNMKYGRVLGTFQSPSKVQKISAFQCSPSRSNVGDSVFHFDQSEVDIQMLNSSYCYGSDGSASISLLSLPKNAVISFIIASCSCDHNSFEILESNVKSTVSYMNLINTSNNDRSVLNVGVSNTVTLRYCFFSEMKSLFNNFKTNIYIEFCKADEPIDGYSMTITNSLKLTFIVDVNWKCPLQLCTHYRIFHFYSKILFFVVLIKEFNL